MCIFAFDTMLVNGQPLVKARLLPAVADTSISCSSHESLLLEGWLGTRGAAGDKESAALDDAQGGPGKGSL